MKLFDYVAFSEARARYGYMLLSQKCFGAIQQPFLFFFLTGNIARFSLRWRELHDAVMREPS